MARRGRDGERGPALGPIPEISFSYGGIVVMAQKNRNRRPLSTRRTLLNLEALEDRTLLSGNVTATLVPPSGGPPGVAPGTLQIFGDIGNNNISITEAAGLITVAGNLVFAPGTPPDITTVNGVHSITFQGSGPNAVTNIQVSMMNGNDTVNVGGTGGLAIPNNLTITAGSGKDTFSTTGVSASQIMISAAGPAADVVNMSNTNAGLVMLNTGVGADSIIMNNNGTANKIGMVTINTGGGGTTSSDSVTVENFASVGNPPVSGIGMLSITTPSNGNNKINVTNSTFTTASVSSPGTGNNSISFSSPKVLGNTSITAGTGNNSINVSGALNTLSVNTGGGGVSFNNSSASSANITVGKGPSAVWACGDTITGSAGLILNVGTPGNTALDNLWVNNDKVMAGPLTVNVFDDGPQYWAPPDKNSSVGYILPSSNLLMANDTVKGAETVSTGNFFRTVTVGGSAGSLSATIGDGSPLTSNSQTVAFNTAVSGAESIMVGNAFASQPPIPLLPTSAFSLSGGAGSLALTVGDNFAGGVSQNAIVSGDESVLVGANSGAVTVSGTDTAPDKTTLTETITVGNGSGPITITGSLMGTGSGNWNQTINIGDGTV